MKSVGCVMIIDEDLMYKLPGELLAKIVKDVGVSLHVMDNHEHLDDVQRHAYGIRHMIPNSSVTILHTELLDNSVYMLCWYSAGEDRAKTESAILIWRNKINELLTFRPIEWKSVPVE